MANDDAIASVAARPAIEDYPWHKEPWSKITRDLSRLPHALLIHGNEGVGKLTFALRLARLLLCTQPAGAGQACGRCRSCTLFSTGTHPDLAIVSPLEDKQQIAIDQIRSLGEFLALTPHLANRKISILHPAQAMNIHASNSLLKLLEEPPAGNILMLVTAEPARLQATIRSRCARWLLPCPPAGEAVKWLSSPPRSITGAENMLPLAGGAPLRVLALAQSGFPELRVTLLTDLKALATRQRSPIRSASDWKAAGAYNALRWLYVVASIAARGDNNTGENGSDSSQLKPYLKHLKNKELQLFIDEISDTISQLGGPLDELLLLEKLLAHWSLLAQGSSRMKTNSAPK